MSMLQTEHGYRRPLPPPRKAPEKKSGDVVRSLVGVARFILARPEPAEVDANLKTRLGLSCAAELRSGSRVLLVAATIVGSQLRPGV